MRKIKKTFLLILCTALFIIVEKSYSQTSIDVITTIAGDGTSGFSGDGGNAVDASLQYPSNIAVDYSGNIYIADFENNRIRKINPSGIISTIAGTNEGKYDGDGGPATSASLNGPSDVEVDSDRNIYIADARNNRIRKIDTLGIITTIAGPGINWFDIGDGGPAVDAILDYPCGLDIDNSGNIYITDMFHHRIRKIDDSGTITTVAGDGEARYNGDDILATSASLNQPTEIKVDNEGNIYIVDQKNNRIRKVVKTSGLIYTVAGTGGGGFSGDGGAAVNAKIYSPYGITVDSNGNFYITDAFNNRIRKVDTSGIINTIAGTGSYGFSGDGGDPIDAVMNDPKGIIIKNNGNILFADSYNNRIRKIFTVTGVPPVLDFVGNKVLNERDTLEVNISASDNDGDPINLSISNLPSFAAFVDNGNGTGLITITPNNNDIGIYEGIVITASDGYFTDTKTISITVNNVIPPETPQNLIVYAGANKISLSWSPNNERYIFQYNIYRSTNNGFTPTSSDSIGRVFTPDTSFVDSTITLYTTYYYRISAVDSSHLESNFSYQVFVTPTDLSAPDIPQNLTAEAGEKLVNLKWNANSEIDLFYYTIYRNLTNDFTPTSSDSIGIKIHPDTTYEDSLVSPGLTYYYKISATDSSINESNFSEQVYAVPYDSIAPGVPQNLIAVGGYEKVNLSWDANTEPDLLLYTIYRSTTEPFFPQPSDSVGAVFPLDNSFSDTGLTIGTTYFYRITASDSSNNKSGFSDLVSAAPVDTIAPAAPQNLVSENGDNFIGLSWSLNSEQDMFYYIIYRSLTDGFVPGAGDSIGSVLHPDTTFGDSSAINYTTYYYKVTAWDSSFNESDTSNQVSVMPTDTTSPYAPQNLTAEDGQRKITLNWDFSPEPDIFRYVVYRSLVDISTPTSSDSLAVTDAETSAYIDSIVSVDSTHYYWIAALDSAGNLSAFSNRAQAVPFDTIAPSPPQNLTAQPGPARVILNWILNTEPEVMYYNIFRDITDSFIPDPSDSIGITSASESSFIDSTGNIGTLYYFKIAAVDSSLNMSDFSNQAQAVPQDTSAPAAPQNLTATPGNRLINLSWNANTEGDFDNYILYRNISTGFDPASDDSIAVFSRLDTTYEDVYLINGLTYYYKVVAQDTVGNRSLPSNEASATPSPEYVWMFKTDMDTARYGLVVGEANGKLYAIGGQTPTRTTLVQEYDPSTNTWTTKTSLPSERTRFAAAVLNDKIYVAGGVDDGGVFLNMTEYYDPASDTWSTTGNLNKVRADFAMVAVNGKLYAISGTKKANLDCENRTDVFDPATGIWSDLESNIPAKRSGHAAAVVNNKIYVFGGDFQGTLQTVTYELNPATTTWTAKTDIPTPRTELAAETVGGLIYVIGGNDGTNDLTTVEIFNPAEDSWTAGDSMNTARSDLGIGYIAQYGLFAVGEVVICSE